MTNYTLKNLKQRVLNCDTRELPFLIVKLIDYIRDLEEETEQ